MIFIFVLLINDNWNDYMIDYTRASSKGTIVFFLAVTILGNIILLNLFLAILLRGFEETHDIESDKKRMKSFKKLKKKILNFFTQRCKKRV